MVQLAEQRISGQHKIRVLVVDDVMSIRLLLSQIINDTPDMEVIGTAEHPLDAGEKLKTLQPDVMTLDVEMPHMSGLKFLEKIMKLRPLPIVMISTRTGQGSEDAIKALELGAVEVVRKPSQKISDISRYSEMIVDAVRAAAASKIGKAKPHFALTDEGPLDEDPTLSQALPLPEELPEGRPKLLVIGASTGGTEAIKTVLQKLDPTKVPPILITQHMPIGNFTTVFARRLDENTPFKVEEAEERMPLKQGHAYVAPGGKHLWVKHISGRYYCQLSDVPPVSRHRPSVDCLFRSALIAAGTSLSAILLTGMGQDGVWALKEIKEAGCFTAVQNEETCVVFGMPKKAIQVGAASIISSPEKIAIHINERYK